MRRVDPGTERLTGCLLGSLVALSILGLVIKYPVPGLIIIGLIVLPVVIYFGRVLVGIRRHESKGTHK